MAPQRRANGGQGSERLIRKARCDVAYDQRHPHAVSHVQQDILLYMLAIVQIGAQKFASQIKGLSDVYLCTWLLNVSSRRRMERAH
jgi:hypothetical protein